MADHTLGLLQTNHDGVKQVQTRLRRVEFGPLPNAGTLTKAHGLIPFDSTKVVRLWGVANDGGASAFSIPHVDTATPANGVSLSLAGPLIVIATGANLSSITANIYIEYIP